MIKINNDAVFCENFYGIGIVCTTFLYPRCNGYCMVKVYPLSNHLCNLITYLFHPQKATQKRHQGNVNGCRKRVKEQIKR